MSRAWVIAVAVASVGGALAADAKPLSEWPVLRAQLVASTEYSEAAAVAARGGTPLDVVVRVVGPFEGTTQHIVQTNEGGEAPVRARLTVIRDGLLDDSMRAMRWDVVLDRTGGNVWTIGEVRRAWSCRRGTIAERFDTVLCR